MKRRSLLWLLAILVVLSVIAIALVNKAGNGPSVDRRLVNADNSFGFDLLRNLTKEEPDQNVFISPASISLALAMTYNGAAGDTERAMAKTLHLSGITLEDVNKANSALLANLNNPGPGVELEVASSLWAQKAFRFEPSFMDRNKSLYQARVTTVDFASPSAALAINGWLNQKTRGKIDKILDQTTGSDVLVLVNAAYFKGAWEVPFDKSETRNGTFHLPGGKGKQVPMMSAEGDYKYYDAPAFQAIRVPYGKRRMGMYIFLPDRKSSLKNLIADLDAAKWKQWLASFKRTKVDLLLPRFDADYKTQLNRPLSSLGMGVAFGAADFSKMCRDQVFISQVIHKARLKVNEEGTEAVAATAVVMTLGLGGPPEMFVDRPFLCAIVDDRTGTILFIGAIRNPD